MENNLYPFLFEGNYKTALWGGERIAKIFNRENTPSPCSESWEICAHSSSPSVISNGSLAGRDLESVIKEFGVKIVGTESPKENEFPLLIKLIDAKTRLSVQVHPNEKTAPLTKGEPKTEMWYVLGCDEGKTSVSIFAGLKEGVNGNDIESAIESGKFSDVIVEHDAQAGDCFFIPGGLVHAIGDGALIYEVQQSSNTTYRLYDWGRVGADGKARELHVKESVSTIDYSLPVPQKQKDVSCPFFNFKTVDLKGDIEINTNGKSFTAVFVAEGSAKITWQGGEISLPFGTSILIPALCTAKLSGEAKYFITTLSDKDTP